MSTPAEKARLFKSLHERHQAFIMPNPYDIGTAKLLARLGFEALATTSAGCAFSLGKCDTQVSRAEAMAHADQIVGATDLPVSADLEGGFGDDPATVAETFRLAVAQGLAGGSIEDSTKDPDSPIYEHTLAVDRVRAAAEITNQLNAPFMLTARCENYLFGRPDLNDTIKRLQSYQEAGASVLYAPGLSTKAEIAAVVSSVDRPVNVLMPARGLEVSLVELSELGVKRVSVGSTLSRIALGAFLRAAQQMRDQGTFDFSDKAISYQDIMLMFYK